MLQHNKRFKYLLDIEAIINELEIIMDQHNSDFADFSSNFISVRAVERDLMIIGEAVNKILQSEPDVQISAAKHIIGLRNMIVHSYDSIEPSILWRILVKDIPVLKQEIVRLKK